MPLDKLSRLLYNKFMLNTTITQEERKHLENIYKFDPTLAQLMFNIMKADKKAKQTEEDIKYNIPF